MAGLKTSVVRRDSAGPVANALENIENIEPQQGINRPVISGWTLVDIPLDLLKPFPGNRLLRLSNIDQLAKSIHGTRLINPIAVSKDTDGKYFVLSGHRRVEAYKLLNTQYPDRDYRKISGYIASENDSDDPEHLKKIWFDANFETRQLSLEDVVNNIEMFLKDISEMDDEEKRKVISELRGEEVSEDAYKNGRPVMRSINKVNYMWERFKDLEIPGFSKSSLQKYVAIVEKGTPETKEAYLKSQITLESAYDIAMTPADKQSQLLDIYLREPKSFAVNMSKLIEKPKKTTLQPLVKNVSALAKATNDMSKAVKILQRHATHISAETEESMQIAIRLIHIDLVEIGENIEELMKLKKED